jgi:hypothetical protein
MLENNAYVFPGDTQNIDVQTFPVILENSDHSEPTQPKY